MSAESDPTVTAGLLALAMGLLKIIESLITWGFKKLTASKEKGVTIVELSPEASQMIRDIHTTTTRVNDEGFPLVYGPRSELHMLTAALDVAAEKIDEIDARTEDILESVNKKNQ
jgi:hypothetical protein